MLFRSQKGLKLDGIVELKVDEAALLARIKNRADETIKAGGTVRADDNPDAFKVRLDAYRDRDPAWSPDGRRMTFSSIPPMSVSGLEDIYVIAAGSNQATKLTATENNSEPAWSPDGRRIAFVSKRDGNREIYAMNADGSNQTRLTTNAAAETGPVWSPDGTKIAFTTNRDGNSEVYVMNADGSNQHSSRRLHCCHHDWL